jgi:hypothetical protein
VFQAAILDGSEIFFFRPCAPKAPKATAVAPEIEPRVQNMIISIGFGQVVVSMCLCLECGRLAGLDRLELPSRVDPAVHMALHHEYGLGPSLSLSPCRFKDLSLFPTFTSSDISCCFRLVGHYVVVLLSIVYPLRTTRCFKSSLRTASIPPLLYSLPIVLLDSTCYTAAATFFFFATLYHNNQHQWLQVLRPPSVRPCLQPLTREPPRNQQSRASDLPWPLSSYHPYLLLSLEPSLRIFLATAILPHLGMQRQQPNAP